MGKREVRTIVVSKRVTLVLLIAVSASMFALLWYLSGKTYAGDLRPYRQLLSGTVRRDTLLAVLMPAIANMLLFMPWGFLTFVALDTPSRPRTGTYARTLLGAILFSGVMHVLQLFLPTRVLAPPDTFAHVLGALAGAMLGHLRKQVKVRFEA